MLSWAGLVRAVRGFPSLLGGGATPEPAPAQIPPAPPAVPGSPGAMCRGNPAPQGPAEPSSPRGCSGRAGRWEHPFHRGCWIPRPARCPHPAPASPPTAKRPPCPPRAGGCPTAPPQRLASVCSVSMDSQRPGFRPASPRLRVWVLRSSGSWMRPLAGCCRRSPGAVGLALPLRFPGRDPAAAGLGGSSLSPSTQGTAAPSAHHGLAGTSWAPSRLSSSPRCGLLRCFGTAPVRACIRHREVMGWRGESGDKVARGTPSLSPVCSQPAVSSAPASLPPRLPTAVSDAAGDAPATRCGC